jgi:hypothetical protein
MVSFYFLSRVGSSFFSGRKLLDGGCAWMGSPRGDEREQISMIRFTSAARRYFFFSFSYITSSRLDKRIIHYHLLRFSFIPPSIEPVFIYPLHFFSLNVFIIQPFFSIHPAVGVMGRRDHIFSTLYEYQKNIT